MTPLVAVVPAGGTVATVAARSVWDRHFAAVRAYYGDDWFAGRSVLALGHDRAIDEFLALGAQPVDGPVRFNPDHEWPCGPVDLVLHLGVLSQLDASHSSVRHACAHANNLVIETAVCDSLDPGVCVSLDLVQADPGPRIPNPVGCHFPSPARIERLLSEHGMLFQRLADSRCNRADLIYDWLAADTGRVTPGHHRLWFARKG